MNFVKLGVILLCSLVFLAITSPRTRADEWNKKTIFTFGAPFEIPAFHGPMVLPAGTYVFKLLDSLSDRDIVQIFNKNQTHLYATVIAVPDYRRNPSGHTIVQFEERSSSSPEAIKDWFYPGDNYGQEFVYPKSRAVELAKQENEPVLSMPDQTAENISKPIQSKNDPGVSALEKTPLKAEEPSGQEVTTSQVVNSKPENNAVAKR